MNIFYLFFLSLSFQMQSQDILSSEELVMLKLLVSQTYLYNAAFQQLFTSTLGLWLSSE